MITVLEKSTCSGCSACVAACPKQCIKMEIDIEGFSYPVVDQSKCVNCGICDKTCPIRNPRSESPFKQESYVVQNRDKHVLAESTAGGAFTAIAKYVIKNGGVVFGAVLDDNLTVHHDCVNSEADLKRLRNSKYVQSFIGGTLNHVKSFLRQGKMVCFSGTPCQVEGLKRFLGKEYENLITVDVVCRAVPSPMVFSKYLELQERRLGSKVRNIRFRDKHYGYKYSTMNVTTDNNKGKYHQGVESDPWLRAFFSGLCLRPSCYDCKFKKRYRVSDFTIWDCFAVGRYSKELDNDKGATRLLIHTDIGRDIFKKISSEFIFEKIDPERIIEGTAEMFSCVEYNSRRELFMKDAAELDSEVLFNKYFPNTMKSKAEHAVRMICYKVGVYGFAKKIYVKLTDKY